ncbi:MAG: NfeD family protein [Candidatus Sericytochromatia bacterium]
MIWIWLAVMGLLLMLEMHLGEMTALMLALGAGSAALLAWAGTPFWMQGMGFAGVAISAVALLRPLCRRWLQPQHSTHGADAFVGQEARVLEAIPADGRGRVQIHGEIWSAHAYDDLPVGTRVTIVALANNLLEVIPSQALLPDTASWLQTPDRRRHDKGVHN